MSKAVLQNIFVSNFPDKTKKNLEERSMPLQGEDYKCLFVYCLRSMRENPSMLF